jgi:hypothetical protein
MGLGTEDRDVVEVGCDLQQFLDRAHTGHAVAHHHQLHFFHRASFRAPVAVRRAVDGRDLTR